MKLKNKLRLSKIEHENKKIKAFNSPQTLFVVASGNSINIYSPITYQSYISVRFDCMESSSKIS